MKPTEMKPRPVNVGTRTIYSDGVIRLSRNFTEMLGWKPGQRVKVSVDNNPNHPQIILSVQ